MNTRYFKDLGRMNYVSLAQDMMNNDTSQDYDLPRPLALATAGPRVYWPCQGEPRTGDMLTVPKGILDAVAIPG